MARKAKEGTLDLYYLNSNNKKEEKKTRAKHSPSKNKKGKRAKENVNENNDTFNFDNEIVIGINVLPDQKNNKSNEKRKKTSSNNKRKNANKNNAVNKKSTTTKTKAKQKNTQEDNDTFNFDNEIVIGVNVLPDQKEQENKQNKGKKKTKKELSKNNQGAKRNVTKKNNIQQRNIIDSDKHAKNYKRAKLILKIFVTLALFAGVIVFLITSPLFNITKISVTGNDKVSEEQIISLSKIELETNIYKMVTSKVSENVKENAYIDTVTVKRKLPNEVDIIVTERKPQYMLQYGNAYVYISSQGYMLEISEEKLQLPVISGYSTTQEELNAGNRLNIEDLKKLEVILRIMESATNNDIAKDISAIDISDANNYTLIFESKGKTAYLGEATNINDKIIVLKQMLIKSEGTSGKAFLMDKDKMYFREE